MKSTLTRWSILAAAVVTAASMGGCHSDDNNGQAAPPSTSNKQENFSTLANQLYTQSANSTPYNFDTVVIIYDVNQDPTAFNALFM